MNIKTQQEPDDHKISHISNGEGIGNGSKPPLTYTTKKMHALFLGVFNAFLEIR